ncbi:MULTISPECIES: replication factor C large subunit [Metallosphaera]|uniref:Replication factor C large subunit n=3 Tax=Metallosphaera TaxID=41980 RepID=A4YID7_METS5|nr:MULTISPECIES: replication factor C large subunit [Metallosphaera]ABP96189.1 replication factor C large subunit [Metallosphaera sedula DSM 5348]AIM28172.1 replication factor C large subunit [Metallosphaera sedula]AKV74989.1 replication factor C large subunit [Metallosphaera sedula]AKV77227.1 replication factor C large subunit [Metallosphaera sedula]AKV79477.1 replication factor C large subunit [Metallosphaera sedula]
MTVPWVVKYRPKTLDDVENQEDVKDELRSWIDSWLKGSPSSTAVMLYGPPGTGKTSLAIALANTYKLELVETNASDTRNLTSLRAIVERASISGSLFGIRGKLIFLDEVDGIQPKQDYGAVSAILEIIKNTKYPILMAANDPWNPNLRDLRNAVKMIEVKKLGKIAMRRLLKKICSGEKIKCEDNALDQIIEASDGDSRYAINFLQSIAEGYGEVTEKLVSELVRRKERELDPFETVRSVFWARYGWQAKQAVSNSQVEYDLLMRWLSENIPIQYEMLNDIWRGYDALARASIFLTRAKLSSWDMLSYTFDLMGPGVAMAEVEKKSPSWKAKWKKYQFPTLVQQLYKSKRTRDTRDQIIKKIGFHLHSSSTKIYNDVFPFFLIMTSKDLDELAKNLDLSPEEIEFIQSSQVRDVALKETGSTAQPSERTSRSRTTSKSRSKKP